VSAAFRPPKSGASAALLAALLALIAGCSAYDSRYEFEPRPLEVGHLVAGREDRAASVLASVVGVHKRDVEQDIPSSVELRLRVDSATDDEIRLGPASVQLFAANLAAFPEPVVPGGELVVPPRGSGTLTAYFPFPDGKVPGPFDLEGVSARWKLDIGGRESTGNATFSRRSHDDGYYPFGFGFGFGVSNWSTYHHRHHHHGRGHDHGRSGDDHHPVSRTR
jgi:hypothetical protein